MRGHYGPGAKPRSGITLRGGDVPQDIPYFFGLAAEMFKMPFVEALAAISFGFTFFGFFASRLLRCSLAIATSSDPWWVFVTLARASPKQPVIIWMLVAEPTPGRTEKRLHESARQIALPISAIMRLLAWQAEIFGS